MLLNEDQECSKVAEMSSSSLSLEAARTEPLLHIQKDNICLKILDLLNLPQTVITAIHYLKLIIEVNIIERLLSVQLDQSTC